MTEMRETVQTKEEEEEEGLPSFHRNAGGERDRERGHLILNSNVNALETYCTLTCRYCLMQAPFLCEPYVFVHICPVKNPPPFLFINAENLSNAPAKASRGRYVGYPTPKIKERVGYYRSNISAP